MESIEEEEEVAQNKREGMVGAPNQCSEGHIEILKGLVDEIRDSRLLTIPSIYNENILECYYQLVNIHLIQAVLMIDGQECKLHLWKEASGKLRIGDSHVKSTTDYVMPWGRLLDERMKEH